VVCSAPAGLKFDVGSSLFCVVSMLRKLLQEEFGGMRQPDIKIHRIPLV
jgi:hypothetical protein